MTTLAILGYGRFGAALAALFREAGYRVRAFDPQAAIPEADRASSPQELVYGATFLVLAVPVPALSNAIHAVRPHLDAQQVVFDVGSVKVGPTALMAATFGRSIPWVATHPLFGPVSLLRDERPLRAVVCPNLLHPTAVAQVTALFSNIGCQVLQQDAGAHDQAMAWTHALAFFIAKGMLDAGVPVDLPFAPPSFQAIARTIESVRADAGHLYSVLHRDNPYAADARQALCEALRTADARLRDPAEPARGEPAFAIPDLGAVSPVLSETRGLIDEIDRNLLELMARRARLSHRAAMAKAELGVPVRDARREAELLDARRRDAARLGLDPAAIGEIFESILRFSRGVQGG